MEECIFCKIVKGELPCFKVGENNDFLAFLDIAPLNKGQALVIPKKHYRWTWDVPNFGDYWEFARTIATSLMSNLDSKMVEFLTHGTDVEHAHIWVVPVYGDEAFIKSEENRKSFTDTEMQEVVEKIKI